MRGSTALAVMLSLACSAVVAQQPPKGTETCTPCHGPNGNSTIPNYPSIAGQPRTFIENQLVLIREGLRPVKEMQELMKGMPDETIGALATYYAKQPAIPAKVEADATKSKAGAEIASKALCGTCHLGDYRGQAQVPRLAGQNETFLVNSMKMFRDAPQPGRDTIMTQALQGMSDQDIANVAHFLATFKAP